MRRKFLIVGLCWLACLGGTGAISSNAAPMIKLSLDQPVFQKSNPIGVALLIYSATDIEVTFNSAQVYDLLLQAGEKTVWQWSAGKLFAQSLVSKKITPENPLLYSIVIDPTKINCELKPGKYTLTPVLCLPSRKVTGAPADFEIK